jgi:hypothetical protein
MAGIRELAEEHWLYTRGVIEKTLGKVHSNDQEVQYLIEKFKEDWIELCHYLYIEAFCHGWKHKEDEINDLK